MKTVVIAIPSLHRPDLTARCIDSIQRQTLRAELWKIVVIENEARPDSILPDPLPRNTIRIELPNNEGTTDSINRGMASVPRETRIRRSIFAPALIQKPATKTDASSGATSAAGSWSEPTSGSASFAACWFLMSIFSPLTTYAFFYLACFWITLRRCF